MAKRPAFGATWWGERWIAVLESFGWANRLQRGRTYARAGHVRDLHIGPGKISSRVAGSRPTPYRVSIVLEPLTAKEWEQVTSALATRSAFAAKLLSGEMPAEIEAAFVGAHVPLFPRTARDLITTCSCPDSANPCKHVAATYYKVAEAFDTDPFLLLHLRGRDREALLAGLRARWAPPDTTTHDAPVGAALPCDRTRFWAVAPTAFQLAFRMEPPMVSGGQVRRLGNPADVHGAESAIALLLQHYRTIADHASLLASGKLQRPDSE